MSERKFELVPGTDKTPPQIYNEDMATDLDENGNSVSAHAAVDAWYAEHEAKLAVQKEEPALK